MEEDKLSYLSTLEDLHSILLLYLDKAFSGVCWEGKTSQPIASLLAAFRQFRLIISFHLVQLNSSYLS